MIQIPKSHPKSIIMLQLYYELTQYIKKINLAYLEAEEKSQKSTKPLISPFDKLSQDAILSISKFTHQTRTMIPILHYCASILKLCKNPMWFIFVESYIQNHQNFLLCSKNIYLQYGWNSSSNNVIINPPLF